MGMINKLFFFDFDGTLYSHTTKQVRPEHIRALEMLERLGHTIVIATGRGTESVKFIQAAMEFKVRTMIVMNGQLIYQDGLIVYDNHIQLPSLNHIIRIAKEHNMAYGGYFKDGQIVSMENERVQSVWRTFNAPMPKVHKDFETVIPLYQGHLYITQEEAALFGEHMNDYVTNWSDPYLVNLIPKAAGKSQAVKWCMEKFQIARENTYAFGDGYNDRDMLLAVGHGIAMGNADEGIKEIAEFVTESVDENGIERALRHYNIL